MSVPEPEMTEPEGVPPETEGEASLPPAAPPSRGKPEWLVGAEEGVASEWTRTSGPTSDKPVTIKLVRPENVVPAEEDEASSAATRKRLHLMGPAENIGLSRPDGQQAPKAGSAPKRPTAWTAASSSVPTLKRSAPLLPEPKFTRIEEREPEKEQEMSSPKEALGGLDIDEPPPQRPSAPAVHLAPLEESPWVIAMDALMHNRRLQMGIGVALLLILTWAFWPRSESGASVSSIQRHPDRYDGKMVRVQGKIGDVYPIAGGYTFYLLAGGDTLVVFTRTRVPITDDHVSIRGTISTGYLDGVPRQALFEDGKQ